MQLLQPQIIYEESEKYKKVAFGKILTVTWKSDFGHVPVI